MSDFETFKTSIKRPEESDPDDDVLASIFMHINDTPKSDEPRQKKIYDIFETPNDCRDDDINNYDWFENRSVIRSGKKICTDCDLEMIHSSKELVYECEKCGKIESCVGDDLDDSIGGSSDIITNYNTSATSSSSVRIIGPSSHLYQKKMIASTSTYKKQQYKNTVDQIANIIHNCTTIPPPVNVVNETAEMYHGVQQHHIYRGEVRLGIMAACMCRMCAKHGVNRKPKEIAAIFGIDQKELSNGEKILDGLEAKGQIATYKKRASDTIDMQMRSFVEQETDLMNGFINRYFDSLKIPVDVPDENRVPAINYREFATQLIKFTIKYNIASSSVMSSKCAGVIHIISAGCPELGIKKDQIEAECKISKSTFIRFSNAVYKMLRDTDPKNNKVRSRLSRLFKKYLIPIS